MRKHFFISVPSKAIAVNSTFDRAYKAFIENMGKDAQNLILTHTLTCVKQSEDPDNSDMLITLLFAYDDEKAR